MSEQLPRLLDAAKLLFDLQQGNEIAQSLAGCLAPYEIAHHVTEGLVERFDCIFARIWLVEPDQTALRLVASSGLYTRTDGSFARVPIGAFKVGKIAQNRVSFLSNNLPEEPWVKDRNWAIANKIQGFAGYPLVIDDRVVGVLAAFSLHPLAPEFLEVLRLLCTTVAVVIESALQHQSHLQQSSAQPSLSTDLPLSEKLASTLRSAQLTLVGTEHPLPLSLTYVFLRAAEILDRIGCTYCRLTYGADAIALEAIIAASNIPSLSENWLRSVFGDLLFTLSCLNGTLKDRIGSNQKAVQILLKIPYPSCVQNLLSKREQETLKLLAQGLRDRDIARRLIISESTVKFHINNVLAKLKARTRYQALYLATVNGWIA